MIGGGSDAKKKEVANKLGFPLDLIEEAEGFKGVDGLVYPDNWQSVSVFCDIMTQWRVGMKGAYGLDYNVLPVIWNARRIKLADRGRCLDDLKIMERAALDHMKGNKE